MAVKENYGRTSVEAVNGQRELGTGNRLPGGGKFEMTATSAGRPGGFVIWNVACPNQNPIIQRVDDGWVEHLAFSRSNKLLAVTYSRGVMLYDVQRKRAYLSQPLRSTLQERAPGGGMAVFAQDDQVLVFSPGHSNLAFWDLRPESWENRGLDLANRSFTPDEWQKYFPNEPYRSTLPNSSQ